MRTKKELENLIQTTREKQSRKHQEIVNLEVERSRLRAEMEKNEENRQKAKLELELLDSELLDYTEDFRIKEYKDE